MSKLEIPESWGDATVLDLVYSRGRIGWKGLKANEYKKEGPLFVSVREFNRDGTIRWDECAHVSQARYEESPEIMLKNGDILLCKDGSTIGKIAFVSDLTEHATINSSIALVTAYKGIDPRFIFFYFKGPKFQRLVESRIMGAAIPHIFQKDLRVLQINVPPLGEQKRIVAKIESTQKKIKTIEQSVTKAEELIGKYREALLQKAFRGELVPQDPKDESASKLLERIRADRAKQADGKKKKKDDLPPIKPEEIPFEIPKSWEWVRLEAVLAKLTDGTHHSPRNIERGEFKYVSAKHIKEWGLDVSDVTYVTKDVHEEIYARCDPKFGDVLLIKDGATTGVAAINPLEEQFSMLSSVALLRPSSALLNTFLLFFLKSPQFQKRILGDMAGAAIKRVTLSKLADMPIPLPPLMEQERIAQKIERSLNLLKATERKMHELNKMRFSLTTSILNEAFTGRLVPQDPSEGTGQELLEKIKLTSRTLNECAETKVKAKTKKRLKI